MWVLAPRTHYRLFNYGIGLVWWHLGIVWWHLCFAWWHPGTVWWHLCFAWSHAGTKDALQAVYLCCLLGGVTIQQLATAAAVHG